MDFLVLKTETTCFFETPVTTHQSTWRHVPEYFASSSFCSSFLTLLPIIPKQSPLSSNLKDLRHTKFEIHKARANLGHFWTQFKNKILGPSYAKGRWDRVVRIVTKPRAECPRNRGSIPCKDKEFLSFTKSSHRLYGSHSIILSGYRGLFLQS